MRFLSGMVWTRRTWGFNHIRIFLDGKKLFDYYPLKMKLFDYHNWHQLTYPSFLEGVDKWETELDGIIKKINGITAISIPVTKENNNTTLVWDNIPE